MVRKSIILAMLLVLSLTLVSRTLTTTQMRENTIRINALELNVLKANVAEEKAKDPEYKPPKDVIVVLDDRGLNFDFDKSIVKEQYYAMLKDLVSYIEENNYHITIAGHTDSKGSNEYNYALSVRRAESVIQKLMEFGLSEGRISGLEGKGELIPIATNETDEGRALNRRIEFNLIRRD